MKAEFITDQLTSKEEMMLWANENLIAFLNSTLSKEGIMNFKLQNNSSVIVCVRWGGINQPTYLPINQCINLSICIKQKRLSVCLSGSVQNNRWA